MVNSFYFALLYHTFFIPVFILNVLTIIPSWKLDPDDVPLEKLNAKQEVAQIKITFPAKNYGMDSV